MSSELIGATMLQQRHYHHKNETACLFAAVFVDRLYANTEDHCR